MIRHWTVRTFRLSPQMMIHYSPSVNRAYYGILTHVLTGHLFLSRLHFKVTLMLRITKPISPSALKVSKKVQLYVAQSLRECERGNKHIFEYNLVPLIEGGGEITDSVRVGHKHYLRFK